MGSSDCVGSSTPPVVSEPALRRLARRSDADRVTLRLALPVTLVLAVLAVPSAAPRSVPVALARTVVSQPDPAAAALGRRVLAALATSGATTLGAAVDVEGYGPVLRSSATAGLPPASTQKLFTTAAVLAGLPRTKTLRTAVVAVGTPVAGRQPGNLWLVGGGDPFLTGADLQALGRSVRRAHITVITGALVLDDTRYDARRRAPGWKPEFVPGESGPLCALAVDHNSWRHDAAFLADPGLPDLARFQGALASYGVRVLGGLRRGGQPRGAHVVAEHQSGPLAAVVRRVDKDSDNFAAELLLKELGRVRRGEGSSAAGVHAVKDVLGPLGVPVGPAADGSGLSAYDRQSPETELALLGALDGTAAGTALRAALPVACQDGTLAHRMCGTPAAFTVVAKTGTLDGVRALAGWTTSAGGRSVRFAFQLTGFRDGLAARAALDAAAVVLSAAVG